MEKDCYTQADLDAALKDGYIPVLHKGIWEVKEHQYVIATDDARVTAYDSSTVRATGSSTVTATGSSTVTATGSSTVTAYDSSTVTATGSSTVTAYDSSTVRAYDSSTVRAYDSSTVRATGSSTVTAYDSSTVTVYRLSKNTKISGGVVVELPNLKVVKNWMAYFGIPITRAGNVVLFKAVTDEFYSERGMSYAPGSKPEEPNFNRENRCGNGLHLCARPFISKDRYFEGATKFIACTVNIKDIVCIVESNGRSDKVKVAKISKCVEVDIEGKPVNG